MQSTISNWKMMPDQIEPTSTISTLTREVTVGHKFLREALANCGRHLENDFEIYTFSSRSSYCGVF